MSFQPESCANYPFAQSWVRPCYPCAFGTWSSDAHCNAVNVAQFLGLKNQIPKHFQQGFSLAPPPLNLHTQQSSSYMKIGFTTAQKSLLFQPPPQASGPQAQLGQRLWPAVQRVKLNEVLDGFKNLVQRQFKVSDAEWALLLSK